MSYKPSFFVLRTPLLPFEAFRSWGEHAHDDEQPSEAAVPERARLRTYLQDVFSRPEEREALFVGSPDLAAAYELWAHDPESARGRGVERALTRYLARMAGRPVPFGLFAGVSVGTVAEKTRLEIEGLDAYRRSSRLDLGYVYALLEKLRADPELRRSFAYRPNGTIYEAAGRLRYIETRLDGADLRHELAAVGPTKALEATLSRAADGATLEELAGNLANDGVAPQVAKTYVDELVENELLVPDLALPVTGPEPLDALANELSEQVPALHGAREKLRRLDEQGVGAELGLYREIARRLEPLRVEHDGSLFQVDLFKPAPNATLGKWVVTELLRGVEILAKVGPPPAENDLDRFRQAFEARYEGREMPLVEALDADLGIGFPPNRFDDPAGVPLIAGLPFPGEKDRSLRWGPREDLLLQLLASGESEVELGRSDLEELAEAQKPLPDSFAVAAVLAARSSDAVDRGDFRLLVAGANGPSGATLLGRFCHGDPELRRRLEEHLRAEEALDPDAIFAEIVHLPQGRVGNITCRPVLREHEIATHLGRSGAPSERQIPIGDLLVSLREGELRLRSRRLGRRVLPRLTSAHNFARFGIPVYRFLAYLQAEGRRPGIGWSWDPLEEAPFLPRVRFGRLILSRMTWNLSREELRALGSSREAQALRTRRGLPRLVVLEEGDWRLPLDLANPLSVDAFSHLAKSRDGARLAELFPGPDELLVEGPEGRFVHELVVPFVRAGAAERKEPKERPSATSPAVRRFAPGSEWVSAALFTGPALVDQVLLESITPLSRELVESGAADRWFFIRYGDPDWHLRVRFHGRAAEIRPTVEAALAAQGWRLRIETYEREVERYGGPEGVALAEAVFHVDSDAALELLPALADPGDRWRTALTGMDSLLDDLALEPEAKERVARTVRDAFAKEHRIDSPLREKLGQRFREERSTLETLFDRERPEALLRRSTRLAPIAARLRRLEREGRLTESVERLAESFLHMHANRMLRSAHRKQELVLYDFLARLYRSQAAR